MAATLDDTWAKVEWAHAHLERLQDAAERFHDPQPYLIDRKVNADRTQCDIVAHSPNPVPVEISHLLGDIVHNLAAALDYLICSLVESAGKPISKGNAFPIFHAEKGNGGYTVRARKMLANVPPKAVELIESLQPYNGPMGFALGRLYDLSIEEKHRALLLATAVLRPQYVGDARPEEEAGSVGFRVSASYDKAYITVPFDPADPKGNQRFDPHFASKITLVKEGPRGMAVEEIGAMLYNGIAHHVLPKFRWLNLLPLSHARNLPFVRR